MMKRAKRLSQSGFTLIELMIAMTIMSFIALGVYEVTTGTFDRREKIEQEGDFYTSIRVALDVLGRDIEQIYSPQAAALPGDVGKSLQQTPQSNQTGASSFPPQQQPQGSQMPLGDPTDFWDAPVNQFGIRPSRFRGESDKVSFVTSSHMRIYRDAPESEFAKITYSLEAPKSPAPNAKGKILVKQENTNAFDDDTRAGESDGEKYPLLEGIKSLSFEYLDGDKDAWNKRWDTSGIDHKGVYPAVIKVTIEVYMPNSENAFTVVQQYRPELPL